MYDTYFTLLSYIVLFVSLLLPAYQPRLAIPHDSRYSAWHTEYLDTDYTSNRSASLLRIAEKYHMDEATVNRLLFARWLLATGKLSEECQ
jgi:hypothetical protein